MMTSSRLVRGTKGRLFACLGVLTIFAGIVFLYHSTRVELDEVHNALSKCRQEQDSLTTQVQVITEYKKNLEKSWNKEKAEHRQTKEELLAKMSDVQLKRDNDNAENVNKYKALQQQYKILQSDHEDLNENFNKVTADQTKCSEGLSNIKAQLATVSQEQSVREAETNNLKLKYLQLIEENKMLNQKLDALQSNLDQLAVRRSSTKLASAGDVGPRSNAGIEHNVLPIAQKSSTAAQDEILQPARPAQPGPLHSVVSKTSGKQSTTPQVNPEALRSQSKAFPRQIPALPLPLSPIHLQAEKQGYVNNGPQGVLPAPFALGSDNQYAQQNAPPLEAPYRLHGLSHQEVPQNQGQMPPIAPVAAAVQSNVLPAPPDRMLDISQHMQQFKEGVHQNMNPFRNEVNLVNHDFNGYQDSKINHLEANQYNLNRDKVFHLNGIKSQSPLNSIYNIHKNGLSIGNQNAGALDNNKHVLVVHGNQFGRADNVVPFHKSALKNVDIVPLDGDVNQHSAMEMHGGNPFVELGHRNQDETHGKMRALPAGQQEAHHYQGGDYDKEDPPANNEGEDEDLDQIDYVNEPNQAHPLHQLNPGLQNVPKVVHNGLVDHHQGGVMVNPR